MLTGFGLGLSLLCTAIVLFVLAYFIILLWDLECDYMNANQACGKLNFWVVPKTALHCFVVVCLLVARSFWLAALNVPMVAYLLYESSSLSLPRSSLGVYDPGEIHNRGQIKNHVRNCIMQSAFYLITFFLYLYWMIMELLKGDPIRKHEDDVIVSADHFK